MIGCILAGCSHSILWEATVHGLKTLRGHGLAVRDGQANFILVECENEDRARDFLQSCEEAGVFVRGLKSSNLPQFVRVSIGSREANDAFLAAAEAWAQA